MQNTLTMERWAGLKKIIIVIAVIGLLAGAIISALLIDVFVYGSRPADTNAAIQTLTIPSGQQFKRTIKALHQAGIITHPLKFKVLARLKGLDKKIKSGEFLLSAAMAPMEVLDVLVSGRVRLYKLTVPEGYNQEQIAALVADAGFASIEVFLKACKDTDLIQAKGIAAKDLEGYLFPDTYYFSRPTTPEAIISAMVKKFWSVFTDEYKKRADQINLSIHETVTLASIIEKETGVADERPLISSVFHNRLKKRMRLESDPTVIYGIEDFDGNITRKHLKTYTPYNTYRIKGLPPGPIANPGQKAIEAALFPEKTDYLFFVSRKDRTHHFSTNLRDHNKAVRRYQLRR
jgi:UPF0755 protein